LYRDHVFLTHQQAGNVRETAPHCTGLVLRIVGSLRDGRSNLVGNEIKYLLALENAVVIGVGKVYLFGKEAIADVFIGERRYFGT